MVTIIPGAHHESVAEHVFALLLAMTREVLPMSAAIQAGGWIHRPGVLLQGRTMGFCGLGRIGRAAGVRARAFGMRVVARDLMPPTDEDDCLEIDRLTPDELVAATDVLSLHTPPTPETRGLVDSRFLARMKPGSFLINTARGA